MILIDLYHTILYQPLFNAMVLIYENIPGNDFGFAVIVLTILIRLVLYPLGTQSIKSQKALQELQPKISEIQKKNKDDKEAQAKAMMELYQKEKINPLSGCLPLLLQLPILIALYQVFWKGLKPEALVDLYSFVHNPGVIDASFIGIINLGEASIFFALLAGVAQFYQTKMIAPKKSKKKTGQFAEMMQKQMLYFSPVFYYMQRQNCKIFLENLGSILYIICL